MNSLNRNTRCFQHAPNELTPAVLMSLVTSSGHKVLDLRKEKAVLKDISYLTGTSVHWFIITN